MRTGRGTRSAAVLMAGLVGAAVIAPGVAVAQESGPSSATCAAQGLVYDADEQTCVSPAAKAAQAAAEAQAAARARVAQAQEQARARVAEAQEQAAARVAAAREAAAAATPTTSTTTTPTTDATDATTATTTTEAEDTAPAARSQVSIEDAAAALENLTGAARPGLPIDEALADLPVGNLDLGDVTIPDFPASGSFASPKDACLYLASKVSVDDADRDAVGTQFASFCGALPDSFDPATGYGTLPDLVAALDELCHHLKHWKHHDGYRHGRDLDCGDFTGDQSAAQAVLEADPSDPNNLDGDNDGKACDWNSDDHEVEAASYEGYPQGGVATGDSLPTVPAGAPIALAGLALAGVAGATRRRDEAR